MISLVSVDCFHRIVVVDQERLERLVETPGVWYRILGCGRRRGVGLREVVGWMMMMRRMT